MPPARSHYLSIAGHEIHVTEWGDPHAPPLVLWHGLARTGRDFDTAAAHFAPHWRVICPDTIGRGLSSWSAAPATDYTLPAYVAHAEALLAALAIDTCAWVGTSMGGLVGLGAAAGPLKGRITRLVLNDIGPALNPLAIERIKLYVNLVPAFATMTQFETFIRAAYAPYGFQTDGEWRRMAEDSARRRDDGRITVHYDPQVMTVFAEHASDVDLWPWWDELSCPVLVLRGEASDLLLPETAMAMTQRGVRAQLVTVPGCGHAPALNVPEQLAVLDAFLNAPATTPAQD